MKSKATTIVAMSVFALIVFTTSPLYAGDTERPVSNGRFRAGTESHSGTSPFHPTPATDTQIVVDTGGGLDTGCTYRSGGPLTISVPVKRVVGTVNANGQLVDPAALKSAGFLSQTARLILPVYDIDLADGEVDHVYFNGHYVGMLNGSNGQWTSNEFTFPVEYVNFGRNAAGVNLDAQNKIEIHIDMNNAGWCMSVDWVRLQFDAIAPILMVHGTNSSSGMWGGSFVPYFESLGIPHDATIDLIPNGSIAGNGAMLANRVQARAAAFGTKRVHLIAHSKGGNDAREYVTRNYNDSLAKVLSLYTLSTPINGTIIADIIYRSRTTPNSISSNQDIRSLMAYDFSIFDTPCCEALKDNRSSYMRNSYNPNAPVIPGDIKFYNFAADADLNDDGHISSAEFTPLLPNITIIGGTLKTMANAMYHAIGTIAEVDIKIVPGTTFWGAPTAFTALEVTAPTTSFRENDLVVAVESAQHPSATFLGQLNRNHASMYHTQTTAQGILSRIKADYPVTPNP